MKSNNPIRAGLLIVLALVTGVRGQDATNAPLAYPRPTPPFLTRPRIAGAAESSAAPAGPVALFGQTLDTSFACTNWLEQGPGVAYGGDLNIPLRPAAGCVSAIVPHPTDPNIVYIAGVNGGVWRTVNATASNVVWTPLTDSQISTSIGALAMDPTDATHQTLVAGFAQQTSFGMVAGALAGLIRTTDGGQTWTLLGGATLTNQNITTVAARGSIILAGSQILWAGGWNANALGSGLFRSTNSGATFTLVSGTGGLPAGQITSLAGDPNNSARFYVHVSNVGVYRSDNSGATWTSVTSGVSALAGRFTALACTQVGSTNAVFAATIGNGRGFTSQIFRSINAGASWTTNDSVSANANDLHHSFAADPLNASICYLAGEYVTSGFPYSGYAVRINTALAPGTQVTPITSTSGLGANTAPHTDSRFMAIDANGNLIESDDGGIYSLTSPESDANGAAPGWRALMSHLVVSEMHNVAYDSVAKVVVGGAQDTGILIQRQRGSTEFDTYVFYAGTGAGQATGDGGDVAVDSTSTPGFSLRYFAYDNFGSFTLATYDSSNNLISTVNPPVTPINSSPSLSGQFVTPTTLNSINPVRMLLGGANGLFESLNRGSNITLLNANVPNQNARMAYGGQRSSINNPDVLYFGSGTNVFVRTNSGGAVVATSAAFPGTNGITAVVLNSQDWMTAYVSTRDQLFVTADAGATWSSIIGNLTNVGQYRTLAFLPLASGPALVAGTDTGVYLSRTSALGTWKQLGSKLPNAPVMELVYNAPDNLLVAGLFGRGAWTYNLSATPTNYFTVTSLAGEGGGTLRDAITAANSNGYPSVIDFSTNGVITLNSPLPPVNFNLTINGNGTNLTIISGGNAVQLLTFNSGTTNRLLNLTLANGANNGFAGGISNKGVLTLANCVVSNCVATASFGGAIYNSGTFTASNTLFTANSAHGGAGVSPGGGIDNGGPGGGGAGMGGAIFNDGPSLTLVGCAFTQNTAAGGNGGDGSAFGTTTNPGGNGGGPNAGAGGAVGNPGGAGGFGGGGGGGAGQQNSGFAGGAGGFGGGGGGGGAQGAGNFGGIGGPAGLYGGGGGEGIGAVTGGGGGGAGLGGAIFLRSGVVSISNCSFTQNTATNGNGGAGMSGLGGGGGAGQGLGGAVFDAGANVTYSGSTFSANVASTAFPDADNANYVTNLNDAGPGSLRQLVTQATPGTAICFDPSLFGQTIVLTGGQITLSNNLTIDATALSNNVTISGNHSSRIFLINQGVTNTLAGLNITGANGAGAAPLANYGGAIFNQGSLTLNNCFFSSNNTFAGGSIYNRGSTGATLTINACTFAGNSASYGGAIQNEGPLTAVNSTFAMNTATTQGGAIEAPFGWPAALTQCTVSSNNAGDGGGIYGAAIAITNTILAGNTATTNPNIDGSLTVGGNNLTNGSPALAPLANYSGPTPTMPPMSTSLAINGGNVFAASGIATDQRGLPRVVSGHVDIGAFETQISDKNPVVTTIADSGYGSLRQAVANLAIFGSANPITLSGSLSGQTITVNSEIVANANASGTVTIDASGLPGGLTLNGGGKTRILSVYNGTANLTGITFTGGNGVGAISSSYGGAIYNQAMLTATQCTFSNNSAVNGAVLEDVSGTATLSQCTFSGNNASNQGGAIDEESAVLNLTECTLANNYGGFFGGAISALNGSANLQDCTVAGNSVGFRAGGGGGGIFNGGSSLNLTDCILAGNVASNSIGPDFYQYSGTVTTSHALIGNNANSTISATNGNLVGTSGSPLSAQLAPLGPWAGPTLTMPPLPGSPAIDAGTNHGGTVDQRGSARLVGSNPDMGAVESGGLWVQNNTDLVGATLRSVLATAASVSGPYQKDIIFVPSLSGATISVDHQFVITDTYGANINAAALPNGIQITCGGYGRAFYITNGAVATFNSLSIVNSTGPAGAITATNGGGGIFCAGTLGMVNCSVLSNQVFVNNNSLGGYGGGIAVNGGIVGLTNCTIAYNEAFLYHGVQAYGGAFYNFSGTLTLDHCTVVSNTASTSANGGFTDEGHTYLRASAFDNGNVDFDNLLGGVSLGANFISDGTLSGLTNGVNGDQVGTAGSPLNALLAPVGYYGGPTETMPPLPGSPLVDAAPAYTGLPTDQRGYPRPLGLAADIGAVEGIYNSTVPGQITAVSRLGNGSIQIVYTNYTDETFSVVASTNVTMPLNTWTYLGPAVESPIGSGQFQFTDPQASSNYLQRYYRVKHP